MYPVCNGGGGGGIEDFHTIIAVLLRGARTEGPAGPAGAARRSFATVMRTVRRSIRRRQSATTARAVHVGGVGSTVRYDTRKRTRRLSSEGRVHLPRRTCESRERFRDACKISKSSPGITVRTRVVFRSIPGPYTYGKIYRYRRCSCCCCCFPADYRAVCSGRPIPYTRGWYMKNNRPVVRDQARGTTRRTRHAAGPGFR